MNYSAETKEKNGRIGALKQTKGDSATFEVEGGKEAPAKYIEDILWNVFGRAKSIENMREKHLSGCDWLITWKTGNTTMIDDKNDLKLGVTGNICLDEKTCEKRDAVQLFVNYPLFEGKYIFVYNTLLRRLNLMAWIHERKQSWGGTTRAYIVPVRELRANIYKEDPKLAAPRFEWFTKKH